MTTEERQALKNRIVSEIEILEKNIADLKEMTKPIAPENAIGRVSRMDAINNKSVNEAALRSAEMKYDKLQLALKKIDDEGFGKCTKCGKDIPQGRLMFMPESSKCVVCAERYP